MLSTKVNEKGGSIKIGRASHVGADALFNLAGANFTMGNFCMISANVSIHGARHSITHPSSFNITKGPFKWFGALYDSVGDIVVGNDVWIGEGTTILPGITIGDGAVVGAASVVTKSIEPYSIYAGNPAKFIRKRFSEEKIELLQKVQWWNWSYEKIKKNNSFFEMDIDKISLEELKKILNEMGD
ncbi:MAG: CatB-related O-acetyltransferase [Oligoflexia bacterium]|nr:CatB-related O-acetyltransferase [Oligoflexia bacterium]